MKDDGFIEDVLTEMDKKTVKKSNKLNGLRFYLAGPIDAAKDDGVGWRRALKPWLKRRKVQSLDPCDKPIAYSAYKEIEGEKQKMMELKESGRYFELTQQMRDIVHVDLRMVDVSDVVIVYLNPSISMCGTYESFSDSTYIREALPT